MFDKKYKLIGFMAVFTVMASIPALGMNFSFSKNRPPINHLSFIVRTSEGFTEKTGTLREMKERFQIEGPGHYYDLNVENGTIKRILLNIGKKSPLTTVVHRNLQIEQILAEQEKQFQKTLNQSFPKQKKPAKHPKTTLRKNNLTHGQ